MWWKLCVWPSKILIQRNTIAEAGRQLVKEKEEEQALGSVGLKASMIFFHNVLNNKTEQQTDETDADSNLVSYIFVLLDYTSA